MKKIRSTSVRFLIHATLALAVLIFASLGARAETPLEQSFEKLEKAFGKLRVGLKAPVDSDKDTYVALGNIMKAQTKVCMGLDPKMMQTLPPEEQAAFLEKYRADMVKFDANVDALLVALQAGDWKEANRWLEVLRTEKGEGHKAYRPKEKKS